MRRVRYLRGMSHVVCTILRPESKGAVAVAGNLAERLSLPLVLLDIRATRPDLVPSRGTPHAPAVGTTTLGDPVALGPPPVPPPADLRALARDAGVHAERYERIEAPPASAIASLSAHPDVELLVAADTGGGPLAAALNAESPRSLLRDVHAPLVLVPEQERSPAPLPERPSIACAIADDGAAGAAAAVAADLADRLGGTLTFVHAGEDPDVTAGLEEQIRTAIGDERAVDVETLPAEAAQDLHEWAGARGADLLVTGPPRRGAVGSALLGSAVHRAVQHGTLPIVIAPATSDGR